VNTISSHFNFLYILLQMIQTGNSIGDNLFDSGGRANNSNDHLIIT
jgi:hypothetical protein